MAEFGITVAKGAAKLKAELPFILEDAENELPDSVRGCLSDLQEELLHIKKKLNEIDVKIQQVSQQNSLCQQLMTMPGIGPIIATILYASMGDGNQFKNGRHFSAWLGIVPKQYITGDNPNLKGISKRGNAYLRKQLINGARSVITRVEKKNDRVSRWCQELKQRLPFNKAVVALANKMARMAWAMLNHNEDYKLKIA
ncbi:IS110 family transposase [Parashewanella spongiae]|nr:IS110 family transposase [Parashewanella spongiae]MCL1078883.1 IS110 family transposase [Parashewanella spongiae]